MTIITTTAWVCTDCMLAASGYDEHEVGHPLPIPFEKDPSVVGIVVGTPERECEFAHEPGHEHSECDTTAFSRSECAGCGTTLAGERHQVTLTLTEEVSA